MNPELYERYLAKKAKKLGISVEELKKQGTSSPVKETATNTTEPTPTVQTMSTSAQSQTTISQSTVQTSSQYTQQYSQPQSNAPTYGQPEVKQAPPQYVQQTIQQQLEQQNEPISSVFSQQPEPPKYQPYSGMQQETVKTEVPSYIFGPSKMTEPPKYSNNPIIQPKTPDDPVINDNRENKFGLIGYPLGHSLSKVIHEAGFKSLGIKATYDILETPPDTLVDRVKFLM